MKRSRFSETEIVYAVKQVEAGVPVGDVARKYGVSQKTIYLWRTKYGGLSVRFPPPPPVVFSRDVGSPPPARVEGAAVGINGPDWTFYYLIAGRVPAYMHKGQ